MWWWMHDGSVGNWWWMAAMGWVWMLVFWGAIVALVVWVIRRVSQPVAANGVQMSALDIAKARYARGEITREQFEELRRELRD
jgi:putative membrane protein